MPRKKKQVKQLPDDGYEVELINRIAECQAVVAHIKDCEAFKIIVNDCKQQISIIDNKWHTIPDNKEYLHQINELRLTKMAYQHLIELGSKYEEELAQHQAELSKLQNTDTVIVKDFDTY